MKQYIYIPQGLDALKAEIHTSKRNHFMRLCNQCKLYEKEVLPTEHPMKSITYFAMAAANLSLAYKLTGQKDFLTQARRWISQGVAYPHWGKAVKVDVDLSASWLLFGFGLCYNWIGDDLPPNEKQLLLDKLILQGTRMFEFAKTQKGGSWATNYWQNHNWIDYTGLAMAGYAIVSNYSKAQEWIDLSKDDLTQVYSLLADDGSDYEGIAYWRYGVIWLALYAQLALEKENINLFENCNFLKNTINYRIYQCAPDLEHNFNFGDCHDKRSGHTVALYYKLASVYKNPHAQWLANEVLEKMLWQEGYESGIKPGILPEAFLELLWYNPNIPQTPLSNLPNNAYFKDLGLFVYRTNWSKTTQAIAFKCASGGGHKQWQNACLLEEQRGYQIRSMGHHHPDANSFILINGNDYMITDEGYSSKKMAEHHNLIIVDNEGFEFDGDYDVYRELDKSRTAQIEEYTETESYFCLVAQSSKLYKKNLVLTFNQREFICSKNGYYIIADSLKSEKKHIYSQLFHFETEPSIVKNNCFVENGLSKMQIHCLNNVNLSHKTQIVSANPTSQEPGLIITNEMQVLYVENKEPENNFKFLTLIAAMDSNQKPIIFDETKTSWGYILKISNDTFCDIWVYNNTDEIICENINIGSKIIPVKTGKQLLLL